MFDNGDPHIPPHVETQGAIDAYEMEVTTQYEVGLLELRRFLARHLEFTCYLERTGQA